MSDKIALTPVYTSFVQQAAEQWPHLSAIPKNDVHEWRNVAMSLVTPEENHTVYRFMFISLLNLGAGTVCILITLAWLAVGIVSRFSSIQPWGSVLFPNRRPLDVGMFVVGLVLSYFFGSQREFVESGNWRRLERFSLPGLVGFQNVCWADAREKDRRMARPLRWDAPMRPHGLVRTIDDGHIH